MCWCQAFEVFFAVWGIIIVAKGQLPLTRTHVVQGTPARVIGVIYCVPLPIYILANFLARVELFPRKPPPPSDISLLISWAAGGVTGLAWLIGLVLAAIYARPDDRARKLRAVNEADRRRRAPSDQDEDRGRRSEQIQSEEDRSRRRPSGEGEDDRDRGDEHVRSKD